MSKSSQKQSKAKRLVKLASSSILLSAVAGFGGHVAQANAGTYSVMGSGAEVREALSTINSLSKPAELNCGSTAKTDKKESKASEAKCGEGKCGEGMKMKSEKSEKAEKATKAVEAKSKKAEKKAVKEAKAKKESKMSEGKCGEGKCGN